MSEYTFEFTEFRVDNFHTLRPIVSALLKGPSGSAQAPMLVDSGADVSMIESRLAERLGLNLTSTNEVFGISGGMKVSFANVLAEIRHGDGHLPALTIPVWVPRRPGLPPLGLLGRNALFQQYDITFQMRRGSRGRFTFSPAGRS